MIYTRAAKLLAENGIEIIENAPLASYTSFRIGGAARLAVFPKSGEQAVTAFSVLRGEGARILVLGNGTNVLISDDGYQGAAVILSGMKRCEYREGLIYADAGASMTHVAAEAAKLSLSGLEFAYGIPGTVGGGVFMNAGAYGGEIAQVIADSCWYDLATGECGAYHGADHGFSYRKSAYMDSTKIVLSAAFKLSSGDREEIESRMSDFMARRREKQPLEYPSAGSVFKRGNGFITAKLIEDAGLKGRRIGGAEVSEKHAGFIINRGGATAKDVLELVEIIKAEVKAKFDKTIECEIRYIEN